MAFDVEGARKAGYTDDEIITHLTTSRKFNVEQARKAGYSNQEMIDYLAGTPAPQESPMPFKERAKMEFEAARKGAMALRPSPREALEYGGLAAGAAIGGVPGAAIGYAAGRQGANLVEGKPTGFNQLPPDLLTGASMEAGGQLIGKGAEVVARAGERIAPRILESVMKIPPRSIPNDERSRAVATAMEGQYAPTKRGLAKLQNDIESLNQKIGQSVDQMVQTKNVTISTPGANPPFQPIVEQYPHGAGYTIKTGPDKYLMSHGGQDVYLNKSQADKIAEMLTKKPEYQAQLAAARPRTITEERGTIDMKDVVARVDHLKAFYNKLPAQVAEDYVGPLTDLQNKFASKGFITPREAQDMKKTLYSLNRKHYGELKGAVVEGNKAIARGLKEELVKQNPELKTLNAKDSALIELENVLERAVNRTRNWDIIGLSDIAGAAAGGTYGMATGDFKKAGESAALTALWMRAMRDPAVASRIAFALSKAKHIQRTGAISRPAAYEAFQISGGSESEPR